MKMSTKPKTMQKWLSKCKTSFRTKLNIFLFIKCIETKGNIGPIQINDFMRYAIIDKDIKIYAGEYWQQEYNYKMGNGMTISDIYASVEAWRKNNVKVISELLRQYEDDFENVLPLDYFEKLVSSAKCWYCGITIDDINCLIDNNKIFKKHETRGPVLEVDRKEPNKEYSKDNVVACCYWCNNAKTDEFNAEEFRDIGKAIKKAWEKRLGRQLAD